MKSKINIETKTLEEEFSNLEKIELKSEKEQRVQEKILCGSMECFMQFSYSIVTMDLIANHLGMSKKTIYKHFKSKEDLLSAVISSRMNFFQKELEPILNNTEGDFISWLIDLGTAISKQMCEIPLVFLNDIEKNAPLVWKELVDRREQVIREGFKKFIDYGIKAGDFRKDLPVEIIVDFYYFLNSKVFVPNYVMNCGYTPPQLYNFIIKLFLEGLFTPFGREEYNAKSKQNNDINNLNFFLRTSE